MKMRRYMSRIWKAAAFRMESCRGNAPRRR